MAAAGAKPEIAMGRKIVRNAASILLGDAAGEVLTATAIALAAIKLGRAGFGRLSEAQAFMEPFAALAGLGLLNVSITAAARQGGPNGTLRGTVVGIRLVAGLFAAMLGLVLAMATGREHLLPLLIALAASVLVAPWSADANFPFQYHRTVHLRIYLPTLVSVVRLGTAFAAYWLYNQPLGYQLSGLAAGVFAAILSRKIVQHHYPTKLVFDPKLARELIRLGWPAAALEFIVVAYMRLSYFFLHGAGPEAQGEYAAAERLIMPLMAIAAALLSSSLPTLAELAAEGKFGELRRLYRRGVTRMVVVIVPILAAACFAMPWLLRRFLPEYARAVWPFRILAGAAFFMFLNQISAAFVVALGRFRTIMTIAIVNLVVYLVLATQLIPRYAATGAAASTTIMEGINSLMQVFVVFHLLRTAEADRPQAPSSST